MSSSNAMPCMLARQADSNPMLERADQHRCTAEAALKMHGYADCCMLSQMCAELSLKSLIGTECRTHDLEFLAMKAAKGNKDDPMYIAAVEMEKKSTGGRFLSASTRFHKCSKEGIALVDTIPSDYYKEEEARYLLERALFIHNTAKKKLLGENFENERLQKELILLQKTV